MRNCYAVPAAALDSGSAEWVRTLLSGKGALRMERIVSCGQVTPEGAWYDQDEDEWVVVLEGEAVLQYADGRELTLRRGDHVLLPRREKHRVAYTSCPCIWLALFADCLKAEAPFTEDG